MADAYSTRARGVRAARYDWGRCVTGPKDALVEQGYVPHDCPFPGDPGQNKSSLKWTASDGRIFRITRTSKNRFHASCPWTEDESAAFKAHDEKRREIERATKLVESWPKTATAFRDDMRRTFDVCIRVLESVSTSGCGGGYRYDDDAELRFKLLADQMRALVDSGKIIKDLALREEHTPACIAKTLRAADAAKQDKNFQRFMGGVVK